MIPNEIIDDILDKTDIVEIISAYIPLKKSGQNFKARCPFHEERTPSFMVSAQKQIYHCFGCGAGGNAISFLMKHEKMDFIEALKLLADKKGISLPESYSDEKERGSFADKLYNANNMACAFYEENLGKECGRHAYEYLAQRGINEKTAKFFRLGFAEDSWQGLIDYCKTKNVGLDVLQSAGLVLENAKTGNFYDRFRNRLVFPIFDLRGRVLGFGARVLDESAPKYINSPETAIYKKGKGLYGINFSKEYIRKQDYVIIVEGYFDFILPFQNEIGNVVATLGTALTVEQIGVLKRFTRNAIMIYDSDKAGEDATLRGLDLLIGEDMNVRIALLPKGADPDSFARKEGKPGFVKILKESNDLFDYKLGVLTARFRKDDPRGKSRIAEEMLPTLAKIKNAVLKSAYLKKLSAKLNIDEESVRSELLKVKPDFTRAKPLYIDGEKKKNQSNLAELTLLAIILENAEYVEKVEKEVGFGSFKDESIVCILKKIEDFHKEGRKITPAHLISCFDDGAKEGIISEAANFGQNITDKKKALEDCFSHIRKNNLKEELKDIQFKIKDAETSRDIDRVTKLIGESNELIKRIRNDVQVRGAKGRETGSVKTI